VQFKKPKQWNRWRIGIFVLVPALVAITASWWVGSLLAPTLSTFMWALAVVSLFIQVVLYLLAAAVIMCAGLVLAFGRETRGQSLEEAADAVVAGAVAESGQGSTATAPI